MADYPHDLVTRALEVAGWRPDSDRPDTYRTAHHPPVVVPGDPDAPDYREMLADLVPALCRQIEWTQAKREQADLLARANGNLASGHGWRMQEARQEAERYRLAWISARCRATDAASKLDLIRTLYERACEDTAAGCSDEFEMFLADLSMRLDGEIRMDAGQLVYAIDQAYERRGRPSVDDLIGVLGPDHTGGLCSVCFVRIQRGKPVDPEHERCVQAPYGDADA